MGSVGQQMRSRAGRDRLSWNLMARKLQSSKDTPVLNRLIWGHALAKAYHEGAITAGHEV